MQVLKKKDESIRQALLLEKLMEHSRAMYLQYIKHNQKIKSFRDTLLIFNFVKMDYSLQQKNRNESNYFNNEEN